MRLLQKARQPSCLEIFHRWLKPLPKAPHSKRSCVPLRYLLQFGRVEPPLRCRNRLCLRSYRCFPADFQSFFYKNQGYNSTSYPSNTHTPQYSFNSLFLEANFTANYKISSCFKFNILRPYVTTLSTSLENYTERTQAADVGGSTRLYHCNKEGVCTYTSGNPDIDITPPPSSSKFG